MNKSGIYLIICKGNDRRYIGQSNNIERRWQEHLRSLRRGKHGNSIMQASWNKYGESSFFFYIVLRCNINQLDKNEELFQNLYKSNVNEGGFNILKGATAKRTISYTQEQRNANADSQSYPLTIDGITKLVTQWRRENCISKNTFDCRIRRGWTLEDSVTIPTKPPKWSKETRT